MTADIELFTFLLALIFFLGVIRGAETARSIRVGGLWSGIIGVSWSVSLLRI